MEAIYRQGDVLFKKLARAPRGERKIRLSGHILEGEATGHIHRLAELEAATVFEIEEGLFLNVTSEGGVSIERFVRESGATRVHEHEMGLLFEISLPGDPDSVLKAVQVQCPSTGRLYFLRVPPSIDRADDAVASTFGFDTAKRYQPLAES